MPWLSFVSLDYVLSLSHLLYAWCPHLKPVLSPLYRYVKVRLGQAWEAWKELMWGTLWGILLGLELAAQSRLSEISRGDRPEFWPRPATYYLCNLGKVNQPPFHVDQVNNHFLIVILL